MKLNKRIDIYVPSVPGQEREYQQAMRLLSQLCGGATETTAEGAWINDAGQLVNDSIHLVYAYYNRLSVHDLRHILAYVHDMKQRLQQQLVSVTYQGALHLI